MKHGEKMLICTLAGLALCPAANAVTSESSGSPYLGIVERNVFGLKPPPPPPDPEASKPPPPKIFLQGITTFGGVKRALFKAQMPPKAGEPPKGEQSFILAEGQRDGDMEVVTIDANSPGSVKVSAFGTIITLDFEHNGIKTTTAAPPPSVAPRPGAGVPPLGAPGANPFTPAGGTQPFSPARPIRPTGAGASSAYGGATPVHANGTPGNASGVSLPGFGTASPAVSQPQQNTGPTLNREEQAIVLAAQKQHYQNSGNPIANLIPPMPPDLAPPEPAQNSPAPTTPRPWIPRPPGFPPIPQ
jgi:hypothetical protein